MSQLTASTIVAGAGDSGTLVLTNHEANGILLQKNFYDSADPTSPPDGQIWYNTTDGKLYMQIAGVKTELVAKHVLNQDLDAQSNSITNLVDEQLATGSLPTPAAGTKGRRTFDSTLSLPVYTTATDNFYAGGFNVDASELVPLPCALNASATVAGAATADTTTRKGGWLMDATTDELNFVALEPVPTGWTGANDLFIEIEFHLVGAETASDDVEMSGSVIAATAGSGDGTDKTATAMAAATYDIGAAASALAIHKMRMTIDWNDATNTVAAGDWIHGYITRTTVGGAGLVGSIVVHAITILVPCFRGTWA